MALEMTIVLMVPAGGHDEKKQQSALALTITHCLFCGEVPPCGEASGGIALHFERHGANFPAQWGKMEIMVDKGLLLPC
jgi:hypothetical protein